MSVREHWINVRVNPEELARIREKQKELGIRNTGAYMRKMAMDGYCVNLDLSDVAQVSTLLRRCSNNLNQYAKRANAGTTCGAIICIKNSHFKMGKRSFP